MTLSDTALLPGLLNILFSMTRELQKLFQVTSEGETLILKKNSTEIRFNKKMVKNDGEGFILTINFYKSPINAVLLGPEKRN